MKKKIPQKWLFVALASLLMVTIVLGAVVITLWFPTSVTLVVPDDIRTDIVTWDWGTLTMVGDFQNSSQDVIFTSYGAVPLTLSVTTGMMTPSWFTSDYFILDWTAQGYEIQPRESVTTTFTLTVDVPLARNYMIDNQIPQVDIAFMIKVSISNVSLPHHLLTIYAPEFGGTTDPVAGVYDYVEGSLVTVTAIPDLGYDFTNWTLNGVVSTENPLDILMYENFNLTNINFDVVGTKIYVDPEFTNVGVGGTFTISVKISDVESLYGLDIQFAWDPTILEYVSHTVTIPIETYPDGVLYQTTMIVTNLVDEVAGTYWVAAATLSPAPSFNGTGTVFEMTFNVLGMGNTVLDITASDLADSTAPIPNPIVHDIQDGTFDNTS